MGRWLYDGLVEMPVDIISLPYDFWYEIGKADDRLEPGETPRLNSDGVLFYVRFRHAGDARNPWPDSLGSQTVEAAMRSAEDTAPTKIDWDEKRR